MALTGGAGQLVCHGERRWASATFGGTRHSIELEFFGRPDVLAGESLIEQIGNVDLAVGGIVIADITVAKAVRTGAPVRHRHLVLDILALDEAA